MKIICLVSRGAGHLDFGGNGYLSLALKLRDRGHDVIFYTNKHYNLLEKLSFKCIKSSDIDTLWVANEKTDLTKYGRAYYLRLKYIELTIRNENPDLVLVDRILGLAAGMLNSLNIKYVCVGSPGGSWKKDDFTISPNVSHHNQSGAIRMYQKKLGWEFDEISVWCNSPFFNIVFIGKEFYNTVNSKNTLFINNFEYSKNAGLGTVGISLGSGMEGDFEKILDSFLIICSEQKVKKKIMLYGKEKGIDKFISLIPNEYLDKIEVRGYVNFNEEMNKLTYLLFFGGIGTLWYCLNNNVVPIIVSSHIHDQDYNESKSRLLGIVGKIGDYRKDINPNQFFTFNATMESAIVEIEKLFDF